MPEDEQLSRAERLKRLRREPPRFRAVRVVRVEEVTPRLRRVVVGGPDLEGFSVEKPAASVRLLLPSPGSTELVVPKWDGNEFLLADGTRPVIRTLTPRRWDADALELTIDLVVHGDGAASAWAGAAEPGAPAAVSGPGRGYSVDPDAPAHVLAGDETAVPAISQLLEQLPEVPVQVLVEIGAPEARHDLPAHPRSAVAWLELPPGGRPGGALVPAVRAAEVPEGAQVWVAGEAAAVQRIRTHLFDGLGLPRSQATVRGYWKHGRAAGGPDEGD